MARFFRRLLATGAIATGLFLAYSYVLEPVLERGDADAEAVEPAAEEPAQAVAEPEAPPRPDGAPQRIPEWAWALNEWHSTPGEERGSRPEGAPQPVPDWYWEWREWRLELAAAQDG